MIGDWFLYGEIVQTECTGGLYIVLCIDVQIYVHSLVYCTMIKHACVACKRGHDKPDAEVEAEAEAFTGGPAYASC